MVDVVTDASVDADRERASSYSSCFNWAERVMRSK